MHTWPPAAVPTKMSVQTELCCTVILLVLSKLVPAQYELHGYPPGYPDPEQEQYTPPVLDPDTPRIQLRLAGDKRKHNEGRVEVYYNGEWGTVCDDDFNIHAAQVVCRELGYVEAVSWSPSSKYGKGEGTIWFDNLQCTGTEKTLALCRSNGIGVSDCKHTEDVGVVCSDRRIPGFKFVNLLPNHVENLDIRVEDVRIRAILSSYRKRIPVTEGYVEVKDGGKWKQICDTEWTQFNSRVICGMFGFPGEKRYNARVYKMFARRRKPTYWDFSVNCTGTEAHLSSCRLGHANSSDTCTEGLPVVVSCVPGRAFAPTPMTGYRKAFRQEQPLVRLRGGAIVGEGRVEVLKNGEWGTICDDKWNLLAATVVCRELGFGTAKEALSGGRLGQGMGPVHMNEVQCSGFEKSITECLFNGEILGCSHEEDAAVRCNVPAMGFQQRLRLSGGRNPYEGRVEVLMERNDSLVWGTVCSEGWGIMEAMVVCRQLGLGFASNAFQETWYWPGEVSADQVVMSGVRCSGTEMSLSHCLHHGEHLSCPRGGGRKAAGVSCSETAPDLVLNPQVVEQTTYMEDRPMFMLQCAYEENCLSSTSGQVPANTYRRLLRFSSQIHNNGQSDFRPKAGRHEWVWHECHRHYHSMEVFTTYDLFTLNGSKVAEGHKASFCLEDSECDEGIEKKYECANFGEQGITVGCWDTYRHDIDCQWIDITDIKPGDYLFQIVINPNYEVPETDYTNNITKCRCRYDGHRIWMYNCHNGGSLSAELEQTFPGLLNNQVTHR
uniref:Lysyl oxidase homolog n=2 Tax=Oryzias latipes TaxID=8090 RepID=H2MNG9_ORYLA